MATAPSPEGEIDSDEELEWQQINEVMNVIEQQYIDAGNSLGGGVTILTPTNTGNPVNNNRSLQAPVIPSLAPMPIPLVQSNTVAHDISDRTPHVQGLSFSTVPQVQAASIATPQNIQSSSLTHIRSDEVPPVQGLRMPLAPVAQAASNAIPHISQASCPAPSSLFQPQTTPIPMPAETRPGPEIAQLQMLLEEQRGSLASHQNRMRGMQAELDSLRALDVENMRSENMRLTAALSAAAQESARLQEQLGYTKQELSSLRDRRRFEAVAMSHGAGGSQHPASQIAGTQIPGTQVIGSQLARSQTKIGVRRSLREQLPSQRPPPGAYSRRSRAPDSNPIRHSGRDRKTPASQKKNEPHKKTPDAQEVPTSTTCWRLELEDSMNYIAKAALRQHLFSGANGSSLWQLARVTGQEHLRRALLAGMSSDDEWPNLLEPLTSVLNAGRGAALTSLTATYGLLVYSDECRKSVETLLNVSVKVMEALKGAGKRIDFEIADKCLLVLRVMFDGVVVHGNEEQVMLFKAKVFADDVLNWARRMRKLPISVPQNQRVLSSKLRILEEALAAASDAIRTELDPPKYAFAMLTSAACHVPSTIDDNAVAALADACVHAVQTLRVADRRAEEQRERVPVWEEDIVGETRERKKLASLVRGCIAVLALIARSRNLVLRKAERNVVLGVLSVLAWPSQRKHDFHPPKELGGEAFIAECRTVWMAFRKKAGL
ncbi:unnamed protein product [Agarophyton chilense]